MKTEARRRFALVAALCFVAQADTRGDEPDSPPISVSERIDRRALDPSFAPRGGGAPGTLASSVAPEIERFVQSQSGRASSRGDFAQHASADPGFSPTRATQIPPPSFYSASAADRKLVRRQANALHPAQPAQSRLLSSGPSPLEVVSSLTPAPLDPGDREFRISLADALHLSDARPLVVAAAQARVWIAEAQLTRAKVLWIPTVMFGFDYLRHDGGGPDFNKGIMTAPSVNYFEGGGAADLYVNLADAVFQPRIARQVLNAAHWDVQAAKNDSLLKTADAYFRVHQYRGMYAGAIYAVNKGKVLVESIAALSRELVPLDEVDRARNVLADLQQRAMLARQEWRVAGADLTQVLRLDPRAVVTPFEHDHAQITLLDPSRTLDELMMIALINRPELAARVARIQAAGNRVEREKMRPVLPLFLINGFQTPGMYQQFGVFGIGPNSSLNQFRGRVDVTTQLVWQLENFGFGNLARIKKQRGEQSQAIIELRAMQDAVAAEVNRALARVQSAAARVSQADRALRTGIITLNGHIEGLEQTRRLENVLVLTFRPQEAVYSLDMLSQAFNEYFITVAEYNRAQFELFHALGYPAAEVALARTPGALEGADLSRPSYLPPVGAGPPPADR